MDRWRLGVIAVLWAACGGEPVSPDPAPSKAPGPGEPVVMAAAGADPLLATARRGIRQGQLAAEDEAAVRGSGDPAHARARRILEALDEPPPQPLEAAPEPAADSSLRPPTIAPGDESVAPVEARSSGSRPARPTSPPVAAAPTKGTVEVRGLSMRPAKRGVTLTIGGPSSLVVGMANQPSSGIVRLIIESAQASKAALMARPRSEGAQITAVRQGQGTVQITLRLDPGWTLGSVKSFSGGARVHLLSPR